jgi:hypothetical protein
VKLVTSVNYSRPSDEYVIVSKVGYFDVDMEGHVADYDDVLGQGKQSVHCNIRTFDIQNTHQKAGIVHNHRICVQLCRKMCNMYLQVHNGGDVCRRSRLQQH